MNSLSLILTGAFAALALVALALRSASYGSDGKKNLARVAGALASSAAFSFVLGANSWLVPLLLLAYGLIKVPPFKSFGLAIPLGLFVVTAASVLGEMPISGKLLATIWGVVSFVGLIGWFVAAMRTARW